MADVSHELGALRFVVVSNVAKSNCYSEMRLSFSGSAFRNKYCSAAVPKPEIFPYTIHLYLCVYIHRTWLGPISQDFLKKKASVECGAQTNAKKKN